MSINFNDKICSKRDSEHQKDLSLDYYAIIREFESDRGRIINSAAVRRLQQKTQVFPLERNAVVRTRLTHSLEVQQVGRYIAKEIYQRISQKNQLAKYGLEQIGSIIETLVEMACLMHDIGNPPFGHFGEAAINYWFEKKMGLGIESEFQCLNLFSDNDELKSLKQKIRQDLCHFEGNAQVIRLVHSILNLNLTYSQIASTLKYTKPAYWIGAVPEKFSYLMKKPGFYLSEELFIERLTKTLGQKSYHRYPLTYIMEAADDISYCIADLEDSVEKKLFTVDQLYSYLLKEWGPVKEGDLFSFVVQQAYDDFCSNEQYPFCIDQFFMYLRVRTIKKLVPHAAERFIENIDKIYDGSFNHALLEDHDAEFKLLDIFKSVGFKYVFSHESIENLELQGFRIINGLLDIYHSLLKMDVDDFWELAEKNKHKHFLIETLLYHKIPKKYCVAYWQAVNNLNKKENSFVLWEFYYRARLIQDYISGMTDHFAYDEYRRLMVNE